MRKAILLILSFIAFVVFAPFSLCQFLLPSQSKPVDSGAGAGPAPTPTTQGTACGYQANLSRDGRYEEAAVRELSGKDYFIFLRTGAKMASFVSDSPQDEIHAPMILGDTLYYSVYDQGSVCADDLKTARRIWSFKAPEVDLAMDKGGRLTYPMAANQALYVASREQVHAIELASGRERWKAGLGTFRGVIARDGKVIVAATDGDLHALDWNTGQAQWTTAGHGPFLTELAVSGSRFYVLAADGLRGYDLGTGKEALHVPLDLGKVNEWTRGYLLSVDEQRLYLTIPSRGEGQLPLLRAYDARTGKRAWEFKAAAAQTIAALDDSRAYVGGTITTRDAEGSETNARFVFALDKATGREVSRFALPSGYADHEPQFGPVLAGDAIFLTQRIHGNRDTSPSRVIALDKRDGKELWQQGDWDVTSEPVIAGGAVYWGTGKGSVRGMK